MKRKQTNVVEEFDPQRVRPLPGQPRKRFAGIRELADSIAECGQQSPGIVTPVSDDPAFDAQLVDGERRLRACRLAGVPFRAEVRPPADAEATFVASFAANFGKQDHDVIEVAEGLDRMRRAGKTHEQLARIAGRSVGWVQQHLNMLKLHPDVRAMMIPPGDGEPADRPTLTFSIAQLLVPVEAEQQLVLARKITGAEGGKGGGEGLGLSAARRLVLRERAAAGDTKVYGGHAKHRRTIDGVESILVELSERIGIYLDMPGADLTRLIDEAHHLTKRQVIKSIEEAVENLEGIADAVRARLPKSGRPVPR